MWRRNTQWCTPASDNSMPSLRLAAKQRRRSYHGPLAAATPATLHYGMPRG
jgi:hypothetical protein